MHSIIAFFTIIILPFATIAYFVYAGNICYEDTRLPVKTSIKPYVTKTSTDVCYKIYWRNPIIPWVQFKEEDGWGDTTTYTYYTQKEALDKIDEYKHKRYLVKASRKANKKSKRIEI